MKTLPATDAAVEWGKVFAGAKPGDSFQFPMHLYRCAMNGAGRNGINYTTRKMDGGMFLLTVQDGNRIERDALLKFFRALPTSRLRRIYTACIQAGIKP